MVSFVTPVTGEMVGAEDVARALIQVRSRHASKSAYIHTQSQKDAIFVRRYCARTETYVC